MGNKTLGVQDLLAQGGMLIIFLLVLFIILFIYLYQKRFYHFLKEKESLRAQFNDELANSKLEIQEQTFRNISQELHDNIGQVLTLAKLNLNTMRAEEPQRLLTKIDDSKNLLSKAIKDIRDLSHSLNTDHLQNIGLLRAIEYELELTKRAGAIEVEFLIEGVPCALNQQHSIVIFRIVQESLNNIIKHAKATDIKVAIQFNKDNLVLMITDNGLGFNLRSKDTADLTKNGIGIKTMSTRAKLIHADFKIASTVGSGVTVSIVYPHARIENNFIKH